MIREFDMIDADMHNRERRQARLKAEIEAGFQPAVNNCSSSTKPVYTMGDVEAIGWMYKEYTHDSTNEVSGVVRHYFGPNPIKVLTHGAAKLRTLNPGEDLD